MAPSSPCRADGHKFRQSSDTPSNEPTIEHQESSRHLTGSSVSSFQHARIGGDMSNNRVYTAGGNLLINDDLVTTILSPYVASGAIFDSAERYSAGRCHPGTRQRMMDQVNYWIQGTSPDKCMLWMYGPAGAGKSSLMQSICENLKDSDPETNGASFFFARGHTDRGKPTKLFVTIAHQLAVQFSSVRAEINDALHRDSTLPTKSMAIQFRTLVIDPLRRCKDIPSRIPIIFIDGLDECDADDNQGVDTQSQIITLISKSLAEDKVPIRFMLASRPEYWIWDSFETSPLSDITLRLSLRDDFDADRDIRTYLTERFEEIHSKKSRIMHSVPLPWPPKNIINRFVHDASGQYIYASTILKFVGDHPFKNPEDQLRIITNPGPHRATAFSELDRLYATIVSAYPEWETMKRVLGGLLIDVNLAAIQVFLEVPQAEITLILDALRSLIDIVSPIPLTEYDQLLIPIFGPSFEDKKISFCHLSFREFLLDEARSGVYHIDVSVFSDAVMNGFFGIIQRNLDGNYEIEPHVLCDISLSEYRRMMRAAIKFSSSYNLQGFFPVLNNTVERFRRFDPVRQMNHPACLMRDMDFLSICLGTISCTIVNTKAKHNPDAVKPATSMDSFLTMANELQRLADVAHKIGFHLFSFSDGFRFTPTLFFIQYLTTVTSRSKTWGAQIWELLTNPGCTVDECLCTIQQHRHIIDLPGDRLDLPSWTARTQPGSSVLISVLNTREMFHDTRLYWKAIDRPLVVLTAPIDGGWLSSTEYENQHVFLVCNCLKSIMNHLDNDWEHLDMSSREHFILADFFNSGMSDIQGEDYFENTYHLSFLEVMVDSKAWVRLLPSRPRLWTNLAGIIVPVLCWFNRELTNPESSKLIQDHDPSLLVKMTTAMNTIFHRCFVPNFTTPYFSEPVISLQDM